MNKKVGWERFALVKFKVQQKKVTVQDFFNQNCVMNVNTAPLCYGDTGGLVFKNNEVVLVGNNGTQINFEQKINKHWVHTIGLGLLWSIQSTGGLWEQFIDKCKYIDIDGDEIWGIGKFKNKKSLSSQTYKIVERLIQKKEKKVN